MNTDTLTAEEMQAEIDRLTARNLEITKSGGFFTAEQVENARISWMLKMKLRSQMDTYWDNCKRQLYGK